MSDQSRKGVEVHPMVTRRTFQEGWTCEETGNNNMGKNKRNNSNQSETQMQADKAGQQPGSRKRSDNKDKVCKSKKRIPVDHLDQIPFKLREIMKSKERMKLGRTKKPKAAIVSKNMTEDSSVGCIPVPHFKRRNKESEKAYVRRMESETSHVMFLTKNQLDRKPELFEEKQDKSADNNTNKSEKKKEYDKVRLQRLHQKKLNRREDKMEKDLFIDKVDFGDVAMAPPTLSVKPRKAPVKLQNASKDLLLNTLLGRTAASAGKPSMARQRIMEEERQRVVEAYRHLKKQKQQQQQNNRKAGRAKRSDF